MGDGMIVVLRSWEKKHNLMATFSLNPVESQIPYLLAERFHSAIGSGVS